MKHLKTGDAIYQMLRYQSKTGSGMNIYIYNVWIG